MMNITLSEIEIKGLVDYFHGNRDKETIAMLVNKAETIMAENGLMQEDCLVDAVKYGGMDLIDWDNPEDVSALNRANILYLQGDVDMYYNPIIWLFEQSKLNLDELEEKFYPMEHEE